MRDRAGFMRNAVGAPVDVALSIGTLRLRASTGYAYGAKTYRGLVQTYRGPGDSWNPGDECSHRHLTADAALNCAQRRVDRIVATRMLSFIRPGEFR